MRDVLQVSEVSQGSAGGAGGAGGGGTTNSLVETMLELPIFHSEWVLWLLLGLSVLSVAVILERWRFYRARRLDVESVASALAQRLDEGDVQAAILVLQRHDTLET